MSLSYLTECACGHVANHHTRPHGCHVRGCPCTAFDAGHVSRERFNDTVREANRRINKLADERDRLKQELAELKGTAV